MKSKATSIILILVFTLPFISSFLAIFLSEAEDFNLNPYDYARITDVEYKAVVVDEPDSEGKVVITERLTFDIHAASKSNLFWELWRDLPEDYVDGVKVHYKVNSVKQILEDGTEIEYEQSPKLYWNDSDYINTNAGYGPGKWYHSKGPYDEDMARYECVFFYVDGLYREKVVFEIEYEMYNASLRYNDCSDLYLALYSGSTIKYLNSFKAEILFPNEDMPSAGNYDVYTYGTNSNDFPVTESATTNPGYYTFSFELDKEQLKFRPYNRYIEFDLVAYGEDKHIFTEYAPDNDYSYDDVLDEIYEEQQEYASAPAKYRAAKIIVFVVLLAVSILILIYAFTVRTRMKSKHIFYNPSMEIDFYRDIPSDLDPNFATALVFAKDKPQKDDSGVFSAILLSLARKEYIELKELSVNDVEIIIKNAPDPIPAPIPQQVNLNDIGFDGSFNMGWESGPDLAPDSTFNSAPDSTFGFESDIPAKVYEPLTTCENYYFNLLVRHATNNHISMSDLQSRISSDYANTNTFVKNINSSIVTIGVRDGYFQKASYDQPKRQIRSSANKLCVLGILFLILVNIISYRTRMDLAFGSYFIVGICCMIASIYLKKQAKKYILFTQFGEDEYMKWRGLYNFLNSDTLIHERTIIDLPLWEKYLVYATAFGLSEKVIKAISIRCPEAASSPILSNNYYRSGRFRHTGRHFRSAVRSGSHSSYGGGGFGYGGGGRGGGGGGGGH
ncbi:MAG: DUF2207 domain-containing protein [Lachnospiraceae bacterium]|nr:DUF2207 domain-containing protein [Lachnospiraceae bacterium]